MEVRSCNGISVGSVSLLLLALLLLLNNLELENRYGEC